ncbi:dipeptidyl-peptidase-4 [Motilibacter rhizosphaerae]|uniref:Dipeptidyl-peptidase-4 n=1 Tax=Motilibacter rhizosphaerae TaxID=598652 RepID=A0A4Q7NQ79_9ACTN|nr:prolyl oligopeptidase family serine peptidase [Motilibacter rhizosphaerae]RZS87272.1 dipeptidyl-peptidase-4 [Motilibacter rhizosphaerae]
MSDGEVTYPRLSARTQRFRLGAPRTVSVLPGGDGVLFVRSGGPEDRVGRLWLLDVATGEERLVVDPATLDASDADLPPEERARRERLREAAGGVTAYALDEAGATAALALGGRLVVAPLQSGEPRVLDVPGPVVDPRPSPDGSRVAWVAGGALHVVELATGEVTVLASPDAPEVTWGLAEFVAAEEMSRLRGFWWAPDSHSVLAARVDESPVQQWWISSPATPAVAPTAVRYPATGTANADVSLALLGLDGSVTPVPWDTAAFPYLVSVSWRAGHDALLHVQSRDQRRTQVLGLSGGAALRVLREDADEHWVELVPGSPALLPDGRLVHTLDRGETRHLAVDGEPVSPDGLQVEGVLAADDGVLFRATPDAVDVQVWQWTAEGGCTPVPVPAGGDEGVHTAVRGGGTTVFASASGAWQGTRTTVQGRGGEEHVIRSLAAAYPMASVSPRSILHAGERELRTAVHLPTDRDRFPGPLPVLLDPYGGPGHREVVRSQAMWLEPQWFADQGFAVVVADGRGTPGRGPAFEKAIAGGGWADAVLEDQVTALHAAAERFPDDLDLGRVGIRGWSFGGYLAALAVLRRPDVFHAAVSGAPVTDWRLYDTHYTERYLGTPDEHPDWYAAISLIDDAPRLTRPLLLIHGLADDNVVVANTLALSSALLAAGRAHSVLPLSGVTHMTPQEVVAENLMLLQVEFLRTHLT